MELPNPISPRVQQPPIISWEEQLHDHNQKIEEYLQNRVFRGCTYESTVKSARTVLKRLFALVPIPDPNHPDGHRHILVWEFLDPVRGSSRFGVLMSSLLQGNLAYEPGAGISPSCELSATTSSLSLISRAATSPLLKSMVRSHSRLPNTIYQCMRRIGPPNLVTPCQQKCVTNSMSSCAPITCRTIQCLTWVLRTMWPLFCKPRLARVPVSFWGYGRVEQVAT